MLAIPGLNGIWRARVGISTPPQPGQRLFQERAREKPPLSRHFPESSSSLRAPKSRVI